MNLGNIGETLTRKYGPLPGYAWVGIGAAGIVVIARLKKGSATSGAVTLTPATNGSLLGSGDLGGGGGATGDLSAADAGIPPLGSDVPPPTVVETAPGEPIGSANFTPATAAVGTQPISQTDFVHNALFTPPADSGRVIEAINAGIYVAPISVAPVTSGRVIQAINAGAYDPYATRVATPAPAPQAPAPAPTGAILRSGYRGGL